MAGINSFCDSRVREGDVYEFHLSAVVPACAGMTVLKLK
jgi:hypothetical protein